MTWHRATAGLAGLVLLAAAPGLGCAWSRQNLAPLREAEAVARHEADPAMRRTDRGFEREIHRREGGHPGINNLHR
jgi:hypothetical protein